MAFLVDAVRAHEKTYRRNGMAVPVQVRELMEHLLASSGVSGGQAGSSSAPVLASEQVEPVKPLLVTYATAAQMLAVSESTLKRRLVDGDLEPVSVGTARRLRVADVVAMCDRPS